MNEPLYTVGIVGHGVVGKGIEKLLSDYVLAIYDPEFEDCCEKEDFVGLNLAVVCVPTPTGIDGMSCNTSIVEETLHWLAEIEFKGVILIKSTTPPSGISKFQQANGVFLQRLRCCN